MGFLWFILAVLAAGFFYWLRDNHRTFYGLSEILVGLAILVLRFLVTGPILLSTDDAYSPWYGTLTSVIALFTGIYAIVRGLDNTIGEVRRS
jgi:hypothetical protein